MLGGLARTGPRRAWAPHWATALASVVGAERDGALHFRAGRYLPDGEPVRRRAGACGAGHRLAHGRRRSGRCGHRGGDRPRQHPVRRVARRRAAFLYQTDPQYRNAPYAGATVGEAGCGPTSLAMVYIAQTGKTDKDPAAMAAFSEAEGYVEGGLTAWRLMTDGAAELGLSSHEVPADAGRLAAELAEGHPVICSVRPGDFTDTGHFLVVAGVADNGELVIHDPNSPANSARTWDAERVLAHAPISGPSSGLTGADGALPGFSLLEQSAPLFLARISSC